MSERTEAGREPLTPEDAWLVWSYEHNAWWGPHGCGYTAHLTGAGIYTEADARAIEADANWPGRVNEEARQLAPYLRDAQSGSVLALLRSLTPAGAP